MIGDDLENSNLRFAEAVGFKFFNLSLLSLAFSHL
jgi:hypothetical protein